MNKQQSLTEGLPFRIGCGSIVYQFARVQYQPNQTYFQMFYINHNGEAVTVGAVVIAKTSFKVIAQFGDITLDRVVKFSNIKLV